MENKEKDYKEERFEFAVYVNDNVICKRNFRIYNFVEDSMSTSEFKEAVDDIVNMIDNDLKSKSRVYTWYYFNPEFPDGNEEITSELLEPWVCTFKFVVSDNKREVFTKIWDGYAYPKQIREKVDLNNKYVKIMGKDGQVRMYEKEEFFKSNFGRLSFELEVLKSMIMDKQDVLLQITKKICEVCSPSRDEIKEVSMKGHFEFKDNKKYLGKYTTVEEYKGGKDGKSKIYPLNLYAANKKVEKAWDKAFQEKTSRYFKDLY